jgi:site-specific DNA-cytosine methylase
MNNEIKNIFSIFDGMSCGQIALNRAGVNYENYFASEIDKSAIEVTQMNYPKTIQLGDVTKIKAADLPEIDLIIAGSPCQGFSLSGKQLNFQDPRSKLFFEFVRLVQELKPKYWLLENVVMCKKYEEIITQYLGVTPVKINSSLVSAQNRVRFYWANFEITQPKDKGIRLVDILESKEFLNPAAIRGRHITKPIDKTLPMVQCLEVRGDNINKSNCLTTVQKDNVLTSLPIGRHENAFKNKLPFRYYTLKEYCLLQTVPEDYFGQNFVSDSKAKKMLGNGWTIDVIAHIFNNLYKKLS